MKKLFFVIGLAIGGYAVGSAQTAATTSTPAAKGACCQKGGEAKACCAKDTKTASASATTTQCAGHDHGKGQKAEAAPAATGTDRKSKEKATKASDL